MATFEEGIHILPDGKEVYTKTWKPKGPPTAVLIFLHGFSDHCNRYFDFYPDLADSGILVHSFDQRGWGRSVKKQSERGLTGPTSQVVADITSFINSKLPAPAPLFLMGHSMGGQECLFYAATGPNDTKKHIIGFLAEGPWIRLDASSQPNIFTMFAGKLASKLLPHKQLVQKLNSEYMCHDPAMCKDWEQDPLCHDTGTLEGLAGCLERAAALDKAEVEIDKACRLYIGHGSEDHVTSHQASKQFFDRSRVADKTYKLYDGCFHCIHLEPEGKHAFVSDIAQWILSRAKEQGAKNTEAGHKPSKL